MIRYCSVVLLLNIIFFSCTNDSADEPNSVECNLDDVSFKTDVLPIIERSCSYQSSCHASGATNGDFTAFESLQTYVDNEKFAARVLQKRDMPPQYAPEIRPRSLEDVEIAIIQCWADGGYQNN